MHIKSDGTTIGDGKNGTTDGRRVIAKIDNERQHRMDIGEDKSLMSKSHPQPGQALCALDPKTHPEFDK